MVIATESATEPAAGPRFRHLPELDGLRAVAVIAVVLFHTWTATFTGGFIGVDVFFVISGFLITSLLLGEHDARGRIDLPAFWGRRVRRLVPAVVVLIVVCSLVAHAIGQGSALGFVDALGALTWTQNWVIIHVGGTTWALHHSITLFDHLWSLAVEEQFYLVWPIVLVGLLRVIPRRWMRIAAVLVLIALSATSMGLAGATVGYFRSDARAFELLGGAVLAMWGWRPTARAAGVLAVMGLGLIVVITFTSSPTDGWLYPWGLLASTIVFAGLVAATTRPPRWMSAVLGRPAQAIGRVSYGIYLWHIPVIRIITPGRTHLGPVPLALVRLVALSAIVVASYRFIEQPIRTRRWRITPLRVAVVVVVVALSLAPLAFDARTDFRHQWDASGMPAGVPQPERILVVGDGAAGDLARGFPSSRTWDTSQGACGLLPGPIQVGAEAFRPSVECTHWRRRFADALASFRPATVVVFESSWDLIPRSDGTSLATLAARTYPEAVSILGRTGARVIWVEPVVPSGFNPVPADEVAQRQAAATAIAGVVRSLHVDSVDITGGSVPTAPTADELAAAGRRLGGSLG